MVERALLRQCFYFFNIRDYMFTLFLQLQENRGMEPNNLKRIFFVDRHEGEKRLKELAANGLPKHWAKCWCWTNLF
ncbi:hypothetical protein UB32_16585 [Mesobacillus subterraneus]|uniref:Uncharacterized protein n=1 Tax=Mesobacillus subterraneus TaxID=285983 RepID=A0A0D6Z5R8_9BACI|nr:hypothetical protein UB32_16585 [Mesobacillus subterraneus]